MTLPNVEKIVMGESNSAGGDGHSVSEGPKPSPLLRMSVTENYRHFVEDECRAAGRRLAQDYQSAAPFPHIVIDNFLSSELLRAIHTSFPSIADKRYFDRSQERFKYQFHADETSSGLVRNLFAELNGRAFLGFLEEMTGIQGLISDPYLAGGGLHLTRSGGHLGVHADFNVHDPMHVERRLNLLVYLNDDWPTEFGGALELWDREMKGCAKKVEPIMGRAVVFSTNLDSFHGHPEPLSCPPDRDRRSIATYYYTALSEAGASAPIRSTTFQVRPGSDDQTDWAIKVDHVIRDWVPPKLQRFARRLNPLR
jgi:Rps23 Pro-64 3,4-dihydroxylase Tpa1-like proline 4-hydroxylase